MANRLLPPVLTRRRIWLAYGIALAADGLQIALTPFGPPAWLFLDDVIDVIAMALLTFTIGFHPLFLPTFITKLIPIVDILPTWTGCTWLVIGMRRKQPPPATPPPPPQTSGNVIDI